MKVELILGSICGLAVYFTLRLIYWNEAQKTKEREAYHREERGG